MKAFSFTNQKYCLQKLQGRNLPNIFLGQTYSVYNASMTARNDPEELNGELTVGSYEVPRTMALDIDSGQTIIRFDNVTYNDEIIDPYTCDIRQVLLALDRQYNTYTEAVSTVSSLLSQYYIPYLSDSITYFSDYFYEDSTWGSIGFQVEDTVCFATSTQTSWCFDQQFQVSHWQTSSIDPCQGSLGLGFSTPEVGQTFVENLADNSKSSLSSMWSFGTGPYQRSVSQVNIGGYVSSFIPSGKSFTYYDVNDDSLWKLSSTAFTFNNEDYFDDSKTATLYFTILSDSISLPTSIYSKVKSAAVSAASLTCNTATHKNCYVDDICSSIEGLIGDMTFTISGSEYHVPERLFLKENSNLTCSFMVDSTTDSFISLGEPFFSGFYTAYDVSNKKIGIVEYEDSLASVQ